MRCIIVDDDEFSRNVVETFVARTQSLELVAICANALEAHEVLQRETIDVVFLDVEMPQMSGIELVQSLDSLPQVILITGRSEYAVDAYEYGLTDYLVKPIEYPRFLKAVSKAQENLQKPVLDTASPNGRDLFVKADNKIVRLLFADINFVEALSDYVIINTPAKRYIVHSTMKGIEQKLPEADFVRVHRSYIINLKQIQTIEDSGIVMEQKTIPIGASYRNKFLKKLNLL